ncbi:tripartite motif-containing protein 14 isoform X2 [Podarcis muralis]
MPLSTPDLPKFRLPIPSCRRRLPGPAPPPSPPLSLSPGSLSRVLEPMARREQEVAAAGAAVVPCDLCAQGAPRRAEWSCLTCLMSLCETHARPHGAADGEPGAAFRGHRVCAAGEAAAELRALQERERWCAEHRGRPLELFCEECAQCVCALCPALGLHRGHRVNLIAQAAESKRAHMFESKTWLAGKFAELRLLFAEEETLTKRYMDEKAQHTLMAYEEQAEACEGQIRFIDGFADRIRHMQLQPDPLLLLKGYCGAEKEIVKQLIPAEQLAPLPMSFEHVTNHFLRFLEFVQSILQKPLKARLKEDVFSSLNSTLKKDPGLLLKTNSSANRALFLKHARSPTLEINSVHPRLILSEDRLSVSYSWRRRLYCSNPERFDTVWQVLSRDSFFAGSHYWEVDVLQAGQGWWIGAAYSSIKRKGDSELCRLGCNRTSWCIKRFDFEYWAFQNGERVPIQAEDDPERVGVFLDYEAGILSFYNVTDGMAHLHTFRCKFTEPVYPALRLWEGTITMCKIT